MRVAIASDIHGNRHAFEAVLEATARERVEALWCLGDLVGYGADPDACVALAARHCALCLAGNHDLAVIGALPLADFAGSAAAAARWTRATIAPQTTAFLDRLAPQGSADGLGLYHASPRDPVWEYVLSDDVAERCLAATPYRVSLIGHSHLALAFGRRADEPVEGALRAHGDRLDLREGDWLVNPGSVGQPRDGDPRAAWLLLDTEAASAQWRREDYDVAGAASAILAAGLPETLAARLADGR